MILHPSLVTTPSLTTMLEHSRLGITWMMAGALRVLVIRPLRPLTPGDVCSEYNGIHWENPDAGIGHGEWVRGEE